MANNNDMVSSQTGGAQVADQAAVSMPVLTPAVDIYETEDALVLLADMPGVTKDNLNIHLEENILTLEGEAHAPLVQGETFLLQEYRVGRYMRQFTLSDLIDQSKIDAKLKNGELILTLPKAVKAKPTAIQVQAG